MLCHHSKSTEALLKSRLDVKDKEILWLGEQLQGPFESHCNCCDHEESMRLQCGHCSSNMTTLNDLTQDSMLEFWTVIAMMPQKSDLGRSMFTVTVQPH